MSSGSTGISVGAGGAWIDVSVPLHTALVHWPGDPPFAISRVADMDRGDVCNVSLLNMGAHTGTHMDAPIHFVADGAGIEKMPLNATVGPARVVAIKNDSAIGPKEVKNLDLKKGERVLFKTRNSNQPWHDRPFDERFVHVNKQGAEALVEAGVRTIGVDYLSVGAFKGDGVKTHRALLGAGVWVIEGLDLSAVDPGDYEMVCLPLKIVGSDGGPARVILRRAASDTD